MKDKFDKEFSDVEWTSDEELKSDTISHHRSKISSRVMKRVWSRPGYKEKMADTVDRDQRSKNMKDFFKKNKKARDTQVKHMNSATVRPVITPYGKFESIAEFDRQSPKGVWYSAKSLALPHLYYFEDKGPGKAKYEKVWYTPYGIATSGTHNGNSLQDLIKKAKKVNDPNAQMKDVFACEWFQKMKRKDPDNYYMKKEVKKEWDLEK